MENLIKHLEKYGEELLKAIGLSEMRKAYGIVPVNIWYNTIRKEVK